MTEMKKRYYHRKANEIRKGRKVSWRTACNRLVNAFNGLRKELLRMPSDTDNSET